MAALTFSAYVFGIENVADSYTYTNRHTHPTPQVHRILQHLVP